MEKILNIQVPKNLLKSNYFSNKTYCNPRDLKLMGIKIEQEAEKELSQLTNISPTSQEQVQTPTSTMDS